MNTKTIATNTINKHLSRVSALLNWGVKNGYINVNFAEGLQLKRTKRPDQERQGFTNTELLKVFDNHVQNRLSFKHSYQFWLPILGLYTGARLNELCQLHTTDIMQIGEVWAFDINCKTADKRLKTITSARMIPIHTQLQSLGFLKYIDRLRNDNIQRVFPELKLTRDGYGQAASKWFARYRVSQGFNKSNLQSVNFHSFRHTVSMELRRAGYAMEDIGELLGHANDSSTARYAKRLSIFNLSKMTECLSFPVIERSRKDTTP